MPETRHGARRPDKTRGKADGILVAIHQSMSGLTASRALADRFSAIHRAEIGRLEKKLRGFTDEDRRAVEALTADVIQAIARVPAEQLTGDVPPLAVAAVVRLFALDPGGASPSQ